MVFYEGRVFPSMPPSLMGPTEQTSSIEVNSSLVAPGDSRIPRLEGTAFSPSTRENAALTTLTMSYRTATVASAS